MGQISERVIAMAQSYIGKTEEKANNASWLRDAMRLSNPTGWKPGESYCIAMLVTLFTIAMLEKAWPFRVSKSTQEFYEAAERAKFTTANPQRGDIVIFRVGDTAHGHAEIITSVLPDGLRTIGFNTSGTSAGNQRNGEGCYEKVRLFKNFPHTTGPKLSIRGYVSTSKL